MILGIKLKCQKCSCMDEEFKILFSLSIKYMCEAQNLRLIIMMMMMIIIIII